jgi:hypothetical protein
MVYKLEWKFVASKIRHESGDKFKNGWSGKGVECVWPSGDANKSIANFRETIPLNMSKEKSLSIKGTVGAKRGVKLTQVFIMAGHANLTSFYNVTSSMESKRKMS